MAGVGVRRLHFHLRGKDGGHITTADYLIQLLNHMADVYCSHLPSFGLGASALAWLRARRATSTTCIVSAARSELPKNDWILDGALQEATYLGSRRHKTGTEPRKARLGRYSLSQVDKYMGISTFLPITLYQQ